MKGREMETEARCARCGETKPIEQFGFKDVHLVSGVVKKPQSYCRQCRSVKKSEKETIDQVCKNSGPDENDD